MKPRNKEAEKAYSDAWQSWLLAKTDSEKMHLEAIMDSTQPLIADSPSDPIWREFEKTLPGYTEWWEEQGRQLKQMLVSIVTKQSDL